MSLPTDEERSVLRAVIFDYGHTLVDFTVPEDALHGVYGEIRTRLVAEASVEVPEAADLVELVARQVTRRVDESYAHDRLVELDILHLFTAALTGLGFAPSPDTVRWIAETEHHALARHLHVPPDSLTALRDLRSAGLRMGVISNAHLLPYMMRRDWDALGFGQLLDDSVISSEVGIRKPHPDIFLDLLGRLGVDASEAVFVGDRLLDDVGGAHGIGMRAILTRQFRAEEVGPETAQPDFVVDRLPNIVPWVFERASEATVPGKSR